MAEATSGYDSETAGPSDDPVTVTRTDGSAEVVLRLTARLHGELERMFASYGITSVDDGMLKALGLWSYLDKSIRAGCQVALLDPERPQGPFDVIDLQHW